MTREEARNRFLPTGGDRAMLTCPSHQDRRKSLSVWLTTDRLLLHCFAGCSTELVVSGFGLRLADLFFGRRKPLTAAEKQAITAAQEELRNHGRALSQAAAEALDAELYVDALGAALASLPNDHPAAERKAAEFHTVCDQMHRSQLRYEELRDGQKKSFMPKGVTA
jgi:hypothetical protein